MGDPCAKAKPGGVRVKGNLFTNRGLQPVHPEALGKERGFANRSALGGVRRRDNPCAIKRRWALRVGFAIAALRQRRRRSTTNFRMRPTATKYAEEG